MNKDARILLLSSGPPIDMGGGSRRTSQLLYELKARFGERAVAFVKRSDIAADSLTGIKWLSHKTSRAITRVRDRLENPFQMFVSGYGFSRHLGHMVQNYRKILSQFPNIKICIVEHLEFAPLHILHSTLGIRTLIAPWFIGSMTLQLPYFVPALRASCAGMDTTRDRLQVRAAFTHLANELLINSAVEKSWLLSKVEVGLFNAVGLHAGFLPYYPVGESMDYLQRIRTKRTRANIEAGLFVVAGSNIDHNRISTEDFLARSDISDLPSNARIVIVGTDCRPANFDLARTSGSKVVFRGRLSQSEFEELIVCAKAILIPQTCGFGQSSRVADMVSAGIPVIADRMVANATGEIPGAQYVPDTERGWSEAIRMALQQPPVIPFECVEPWLEASKALVAQELASLKE
jgi:hypothetical protein